MARFNKQNIDRKTNKPNPKRTEGFIEDDVVLNRADQIRRDDDVIITPKRTLYDIDYAIKWYIENEIRPQIEADKQLLSVPVIFSNGEKWDNVRRLGYIRDEKGMLQSPLIMIKRGSVTERDDYKTLDVNRNPAGNYIVAKNRYNKRNRYSDSLFPFPANQPAQSEEIYVVNIPKQVKVEYELMLWCDFTTQMNQVVDQILPYGRFAWGNETNRFKTTIGQFTFETVNTVGDDRLVRATVPLSVEGTLLSEHEARLSTLKKMYSIKKVTFDMTVTTDIFQTTRVPQSIITSGVGTIIIDDVPVQISGELMNYLTSLTDKQATYSDSTTVTVSAAAAINPLTLATANKNEFDVYINGTYIDKVAYTWTPSDTASQTIVFDTVTLGYDIESTDLIIINGRWA